MIYEKYWISISTAALNDCHLTHKPNKDVILQFSLLLKVYSTFLITKTHIVRNVRLPPVCILHSRSEMQRCIWKQDHHIILKESIAVPILSIPTFSSNYSVILLERQSSLSEKSDLYTTAWSTFRKNAHYWTPSNKPSLHSAVAAAGVKAATGRTSGKLTTG